MSIALKTVGIVVESMPATLAFYRTAGLEIEASADGEQNADITLPSGLVLGFLTQQLAAASDPGYTTSTGSSLNLQFECDVPASVDAVHDKLVAAGYASYTAPWDAFWGQRFARVADPDGRIVNFYAEL